MQYSSNLMKLLPIIGLFVSAGVFAQSQDSISAPIAKGDSIVRVSGPQVTGVVKDAASGRPLAGIYVGIPNFSSAITNDKGEFSITVPNLSIDLTLTGQGYQQKKVAVKGRNNVSEVLLYEENYGSVYSTVRLPFSETFASSQPNAINGIRTLGAWETPTHELPDTYLQGRVAGLNVVRRSGVMNTGANLFLRGINSLNASNAPLIVVDGMIYDTQLFGNSSISGFKYNPFSNLDIRDIDSYTILKDASASIYGTKGGNGVILISTNNHPELATKIDFSAYGNYNFLPKNRYIPVMNGDGHRTYLADVLKTGSLTQTQIAALPYMNDSQTNSEYYAYHDQSGNLISTDWQDKVFSGAFNNNYNLRVSGGDNIARYVLSMGYGGNKGIVESTDMSRYSTRFNGNLNISEKLAINTALSFVFNEQNLRDQGLTLKTNPIYLSLLKSPFVRTNRVDNQGIESPNLTDVDALGYGNPVALVGENTRETNQSYRFFGNINFKYSFNKYLIAQTLVGLTSDKVRENVFIPREGVANDTTSAGGQFVIADSRLGNQVQRMFDFYNDTRLSYNRTFNNVHQLDAFLGLRFKQSDFELASSSGFNSAIDELVYIQNSAVGRRTAGEIGTYRWLSNYLSANYQLYNRYILGMNLALDGSSRFGSDALQGLNIDGVKFAFLPSVSAAWLISSEKFMSGVKPIEFLKMRVSYGLTGNDDIGNYTARQYYVSQNLLGLQGLVRGNLGNSELQWERNKKFNLGLDASFLGERLTFSADYFSNKTEKMLVQDSLPTFTGFPYTFTNKGGMQTRGFEIGVNSRIINKNNFKWDLGFNISKYKNEITELPGGRLESSYAGATVLTQVGLPAGVFYGFKTNGVYASNAEATGAGTRVLNPEGDLIPQQGGDMRFVDVDGNNIIDDRDRQVIGDANADFFGGLNTALSYKRFSVNALLTFSKGNDIYNYPRRQLESQNGLGNQSQAILNRWRGEGQVTNIPRASFGDPSGNSAFSDRWIEDGSYMRLRTVSVSYDVPASSKVIKYIRVYLTGNNLLTFSRYLGYDPEVTGGESVLLQGFDTSDQPQYKTVQMGLRIGI